MRQCWSFRGKQTTSQPPAVSSCKPDDDTIDSCGSVNQMSAHKIWWVLQMPLVQALILLGNLTSLVMSHQPLLCPVCHPSCSRYICQSTIFFCSRKLICMPIFRWFFCNLLYQVLERLHAVFVRWGSPNYGAVKHWDKLQAPFDSWRGKSGFVPPKGTTYFREGRQRPAQTVIMNCL